MIAPLRHVDEEADPSPLLSETARRISARLLPAAQEDETVEAVPAWQAWLLAAWMIVTSLAYLGFMLGLLC